MNYLLLLLFFNVQVYCQKEEVQWWKELIRNGQDPWAEPTKITSYTNYPPPCNCVKSYQCSDSGMIIADGSGIVGWRISQAKLMCHDDLVCCIPPSKTSEEEKVKGEESKPGAVISLGEVHPIQTSEEGESYAIEITKEQQSVATADGETCGERAYEPSDISYKISGDQDETATELGDFPWMLLMNYEDQGVRQRIGGATLIHPQVAVTAGHSVLKKDWDKITIRAAEYNLDEEDESKTQDAKVEKIIYHPLMKLGKQPEYDIAVIILKYPFDLSLTVRTICLPPANSAIEWTSCYATGWGSRGKDAGKGPRILRQAEMSLISKDKCNSIFRRKMRKPSFQVHDSFICYASNTTADTCQGDGGGPLLCRNEDSPAFHLIGVTSWGLKCGEKGVPGAYADVSLVIDFILNTLSKENIHLGTYKYGQVLK